MKTFLILGGDYRMLTCAETLKHCGMQVLCYGVSDPGVSFKEESVGTLEDAVLKADFILLPLPYTTDGIFIHTPLHTEKISIRSLLSMLKKHQTVLAGKADSLLASLLSEKGIPLFDYAEREEFAILNAIPTAEGAIEIALKERPATLWGAKCLVTGFGRISKILAHRLKAFGTEVTVSARKASDLAFINAYGYSPIETKDIKKHISSFDIIFNTVPHKILDDAVLQKTRADALIIDLASRPGGVDFESAQNLGLSVIWALSLPGKSSPKTAGRIIADTALNIVNEMEEQNGK